MKQFSLFALAASFAKDPNALDLGQISHISRKQFHEIDTFSFTSAAPTVEYACLLIEHALLLRTRREGRIYAGFEKLSFMEPVVDRYLRIADISESLFVFGEPNWRPPRHPNIRIIPLQQEFQLAHEWFLIADTPTLQMAIVSEDCEGVGRPPEQRTLRIVKSSNPELIAKLGTAMEGLINWTMAA